MLQTQFTLPVAIRAALLVSALGLATSCGNADDGAPAEQAAPRPAAGASPDTSPTADLPVHRSPIAGSWYPGQAPALRAQLREFFLALPDDLTSQTEAAGQPIAAITPHAGYRFSGQTAAYAASWLAARRPRFKRIVILGPSHSAGFRGASIGRYSAYRTPLGDAAIDLEAVERLRRCALVTCEPAAHLREHSVDIQVPMLQFAFRDALPPIVPIVVGRLAEKDYSILARALHGVLSDDGALLVSSDFTHYGPNHGYTPFPHDAATAERLAGLNRRAVAAIESGGRAKFLEYCGETKDTICGRLPIALLLEALPEDAKGRRLHYATSGELTGDFSNSVTYVAMGFSHPTGWPASSPETVTQANPEQERGTLTKAEQHTLLELARQSLQAAVREESPPSLEACKAHPALANRRAAFVTLKKRGTLRGCIGSIFPQESLATSVRRHAANAAVNDPRFPRVTPEELPELHIEVSALTVPSEVDSHRDIEIGRDGVVLRVGRRQAVFLPQVAPEQGWDLEETLQHLSRKAGLPPDAWRAPQARFLTFQAHVFGE